MDVEASRPGDDADRLATLFRGLARLETKGELGEAIAPRVEQVSIYEIAMLCAVIEHGIAQLPPSYAKRLRPYMQVRLFGDRQRILALAGDGSFRKMSGSITDKEKYAGYCQMIIDTGGDIYGNGQDYVHFMTAGSALYCLTTCFALFVMDEPGHPVGMPFPGGFSVEERDGVYYCPVRDREKDVKHSICNFCPARQADLDPGSGRSGK